jgi:hypothetical protein
MANEENQREAQEALDQWGKFLSSPSWARIKYLIQAQVDGRMPSILAPLNGTEDIYSQEFLKGEIAGIRLMEAIPHLEIERLTPIAEGE